VISLHLTSYRRRRRSPAAEPIAASSGDRFVTREAAAAYGSLQRRRLWRLFGLAADRQPQRKNIQNSTSAGDPDSNAFMGDVISSRPGRRSIATATIARALFTRWSCRSVNSSSSPSAFDRRRPSRNASNNTTIRDSKRKADLLFHVCAVEVVEGVSVRPVSRRPPP
jgi:hypothetical protein